MELILPVIISLSQNVDLWSTYMRTKLVETAQAMVRKGEWQVTNKPKAV